MKQAEIFEKYTDFISDTQDIPIWGFDSRVIQESYGTYSYSIPVEIQLFRALERIAKSENKSVREKSFTIFMGDFGPGFELYGLGVSARVNSKITDIF